ncbi:MAG: 30S ribosomal protein S4 [Candidatus Micrarchaeia archaeon]|jgi:small subunit ribosomal protein S4
MGAPKRKRKLYESPKRLWDKARIEEESKLVEEYGLKNMRELWRMKTMLRKIRREARRLLSKKGTHIEERTTNLLKRVQRFLVNKPEITLDDILSLDTRDILNRRLQTVAHKKHFGRTSKQARQFIVHGHILVNGQKVTAPSYLVKFNEEDKIEWNGNPINFESQPPLPEQKQARKTEEKASTAPAQPAEAQASS